MLALWTIKGKHVFDMAQFRVAVCQLRHGTFQWLWSGCHSLLWGLPLASHRAMTCKGEQATQIRVSHTSVRKLESSNLWGCCLFCLFPSGLRPLS